MYNYIFLQLYTKNPISPKMSLAILLHSAHELHLDREDGKNFNVTVEFVVNLYYLNSLIP